VVRLGRRGGGDPAAGGRGRGGGDDKTTMELAFWRAIEKSERPDDFEAYLQQYPEGSFAPLAKSRLAALKEKEDKTEPGNVGGKWLSEAT